ncbi:hypothetical protein HCY59_08460 [Limosilactobacillus fermentum]
MSKKILYKDAWQSIGRSPGRFIALVLLMLLGTFSFVGLKITGPPSTRRLRLACPTP